MVVVAVVDFLLSGRLVEEGIEPSGHWTKQAWRQLADVSIMSLFKRSEEELNFIYLKCLHIGCY